MKTIGRILMAVLLLTGFTASCTNDLEEATWQTDSYLEIDAVAEAMSREAIDETFFYKGAEIGVFVRDLDGKDYDAAVMCSNIKATYDGSKWSLSSQVPLKSGKEAVVYAYYPYNANAVVSGDSIDVDITKQEDLMYGSASGVTTENPTARIGFKHALARITLSITKAETDIGGYGKLSNVRMRNLHINDLHHNLVNEYVIGLQGRMDLRSGSLNVVRNYKDEISIPVYMDFPLSQNPTNIEFLFAPNRRASSRTAISYPVPSYVSVCLTIDGKTYGHTIYKPQWYAGQQYIYPISVNRTTVPKEEPADKVYMGSDTNNGEPLYWASHNLGATSPEDYGGLYGWGDITGTNTSENLDEYPSATPPADLNSTDYVLPRIKWGGKWRYPTWSDISKLKSCCEDPEFVELNGVECVKFTSKVNGNVLYFPKAPMRIGNYANKQTTQSYYWLSELNESDHTQAYTFYLDFYWQNAWVTAGQPRYYGLPIRPVTE